MDKIGIIGLGFVGSAIQNAFEVNFDAELIIRDPAKGHNATWSELAECVGIFVCVPTPSKDNGGCDIGILEDVLEDLYHVNYNGVIISKCTAPPDAYTIMNNQYLNLVHAPEFLTAANAQYDYYHGKFAIIGGRLGVYVREAERIIKFSQPHLEQVIHCSIAEASLAKYTINSFLATKVAFMNELYNLSKETNCDYNKVASAVMLDKRIGSSHMQVPGPDGQFGFGGACFPKDTSALLSYADKLGVSLNVLDAAVKKNTLLRLQKPK